tara:strand:+ start:823 stop:951 length:129 start_codon:yes stop_codon:yes gene_type:complete
LEFSDPLKSQGKHEEDKSGEQGEEDNAPEDFGDIVTVHRIRR